MNHGPGSRERLVTTARELLWETGYHHVSVDDLCERADVRKGTFYHFFPSKSALAIAALEAGWDEKRAAYDGIFSAARPPMERLAAFTDYLIANQEAKAVAIGRVCGCPLVTLGCEESAHDPQIREKIIELNGRSKRYLRTLIRDAVDEGAIPPCDPDVKADEMLSLVMGAHVRGKIENDLKPIHQLQAALRSQLGVASPTLQEALVY